MAEEKAAEGNTTYFSEFSSDELDTKLKRKDEDGRTLLHVAAAAGTRPAPTRPAQISFPTNRRRGAQPRTAVLPTHDLTHPPVTIRRQDRARRAVPREPHRPSRREQGRRGTTPSS